MIYMNLFFAIWGAFATGLAIGQDRSPILHVICLALNITFVIMKLGGK